MCASEREEVGLGGRYVALLKTFYFRFFFCPFSEQHARLSVIFGASWDSDEIIPVVKRTAATPPKAPSVLEVPWFGWECGDRGVAAL